MKDLVSVIMPVFNRESMIGDALDSVVRQTYPHWETVVVDDGSNDDTSHVVEGYARKDPRIRLIRHDARRGAQAARNTGIKVAQGKYVALLDSDDQWLPEKLQLQLGLFANQCRKLGVVYAGYSEVHADGSITEQLPRISGDVYQRLLSDYGVAPLTLVIKRECFDRVGLFDERVRAFHEWDMCIRLAKHYDFQCVHRPLALYYLHEGPTISKDLLLSAQGYLDVVRIHRDEVLQVCGQQTMRAHLAMAQRLFHTAARSYFRTGQLGRAWRAFSEGLGVRSAGRHTMGPRITRVETRSS